MGTDYRKFISLAAWLVALGLALGSNPLRAEAAGATIVVDASNPATLCGSYTGKPSMPNVVTTINGAASGSTVVICPGTYTLSGLISISGKTLTIKRALTGPGSQPILTVATAAVAGIAVSNASTVTIDGLVLDAHLNTQTNFNGLSLSQSSATIKNTGIIGPNQTSSSGIYANASGQTTVRKLSVVNSYIAGYRAYGMYAEGPIKLSVSTSHLDASDGGRVVSTSSSGVVFGGAAVGAGPTGTVTKNRILNNDTGVLIVETSKVSVTNNTLIDNTYGVFVAAYGSFHNADNTKISGNTILGVPSGGYGVYILDNAAATFSVKKTTVSTNVIAASQYSPNAAGPTGVYVSANVMATTMVTATISKNTFLGFPVTPTSTYIVNVASRAGLTTSGNETIP